ncbi:MAG TPA: hypothetical protein VM529_27230 [Gemmata sp.]|nr:hypothetical protein [Gemmata sp.]
MAELTISLTRSPGTGRLMVRVGYRCDDDAMPHEHEVQHRRLVAELFPGLELTEDRDESVFVERERPAREPVVG